jgi:glycosyltransferase involved in cell wall biosynthesis
MRDLPVVTVILTVYRRTEFLEEAIRSVVLQTFTLWECIVTDDGGTSAVRDICSRFAEDSRIRYRRNETALGAPLNIAAAMREARGRYLVILNDDDRLYPHMLEMLVAALEANPEAVAAFGNHDIMDAQGRIMAKETEAELQTHGRVGLGPGQVQDTFGFAVRGGLMVGMGSVLRRTAVDPGCLVREVGGAYDYWLSIKVAAHGPFFYVPENVMAWRSHPNSVSSTVSPATYASEIYIYDTLLAEGLKPPLDEHVRQRLAECLSARGLIYLQQRWSVREARSALFRSFRLSRRLATLCYWLSTLIPAQARDFSLRLWRRIKRPASNPSP